ncbi:hypothetical protein FSOLCH5_003697 [Fusarium solani]
MGLHGLMIWAIDLNTPYLEALRAISKGELIGHTQAPFSLVDLERVFPAEMLPPEDAETNYALVKFGGNADAGETDPNQTCFGFVLVTGDSHAVLSLKKREDEPEPLVFLDCPLDILERPKNETQTATVIKACHLSTRPELLPTSKVFDFAFDMNLNRTQRDAGNTKIRIDYSNV